MYHEGNSVKLRFQPVAVAAVLVELNNIETKEHNEVNVPYETTEEPATSFGQGQIPLEALISKKVGHPPFQFHM